MIDIETILDSKGLYITRLPSGESFSYRLLTIKEYKVFRQLREAGEIPPLCLYEEIFSRCYIGNPLAISGNLPAGLFPSIGQAIMHLSGDLVIGHEADAIAQARTRYVPELVEETMKRRVLVAFPYKPDDLATWSYQTLLDQFVLAEAVLLDRNPEYEPIELKKIGAKSPTQKKGAIDFNADNMAIAQEGADVVDPFEMTPAEFEALGKRRGGLTPTAARKLDQVTKRK